MLIIAESFFLIIITSSSVHISIAPFTGEPEQLEFFITQVTGVAACNKWNDKQTLTYARSKLKGPARNFFIKKTEYNHISTSAELFAVLRAQFRKHNECHAISDFHTIAMQADDSIRNFAHKLDSLAPKAHEVIKDKEALNSINFNKFISVIPNNFHIHILQNNIKTYNDAVDKAALLEDCNINNQFICQDSTSSNPLQ